MKTTVSVYDFRRAFETTRPDNFSYEALGLMFDHFEEIEQDTGEEIELDVDAICCEYTEDTVENIAGNYDIDLSEAIDGMDEASAYGLEQIQAAKLEIMMAYLNDHTSVVGETSSGIVYANF